MRGKFSETLTVGDRKAVKKGYGTAAFRKFEFDSPPVVFNDIIIRFFQDFFPEYRVYLFIDSDRIVPVESEIGFEVRSFGETLGIPAVERFRPGFKLAVGGMVGVPEAHGFMKTIPLGHG
jgi:hypothetical protein